MKGDVMAEVIDAFRFNSRFGNRKLYPWDEWFDGRIWKLRSGVDFQITSESFRNGLASAAKRHGKKVHGNRIVEDGVVYIVLQAYTTDDNGKASE